MNDVLKKRKGLNERLIALKNFGRKMIDFFFNIIYRYIFQIFQLVFV
jgi:hypothetical protein